MNEATMCRSTLSNIPETTKTSARVNAGFSETKLCEYPLLFHKYLLGFVEEEDRSGTNPDRAVLWSVVADTRHNLTGRETHRLIAHLHCRDISVFYDMYGEHIRGIENECSLIIVTYSIGGDFLDSAISISAHLAAVKNLVLLKIPDKGMDVGAKILAVQYLATTRVEYAYILFLHSKSDVVTRSLYFEPLLDNLAQISKEIAEISTRSCARSDEPFGYFPPLIRNGTYSSVISGPNICTTHINSQHTHRNIKMHAEMCAFTETDPHLALFPEGNVYILRNSVATELFQPIYYPLLNTSTTIDIHWVMIYYNLSNDSTIAEVYDFFKGCPNAIGNNLMSDNAHPDSQFEHVFERMVFNVIRKQRGQIRILPLSGNEFESVKWTGKKSRIKLMREITALEWSINTVFFNASPKIYPTMSPPSNNRFLSRSPCHIDGDARVDAMTTPLIWINLPSRVDRAQSMRTQLAAIQHLCPRPEMRVPGIPLSRDLVDDGIMTTGENTDLEFDAQLRIFSTAAFKTGYFSKTNMALSEIGCLMSHMRAMHTSLVRYPDAEYVTIVEDDADLISWASANRTRRLNDELSETRPECVQLSCILSEPMFKQMNREAIKQMTRRGELVGNTSGELFPWNDQAFLSNGSAVSWGATGYIISRAARVRFVNMVKSVASSKTARARFVGLPADFFVFSHATTQIMFPPIISYHSRSESSIRPNNDLQVISHYNFTNSYFKSRCLLVATVFGEIPTIFDAWVRYVANSASYFSVLLVGDAVSPAVARKFPANLTYLHMASADFIRMFEAAVSPASRPQISTHPTIASAAPWLGHMFSDYIVYKYVTWGVAAISFPPVKYTTIPSSTLVESTQL